MEHAEIRLECLKLAVSLVTGGDAMLSKYAGKDPIVLADQMAAFAISGFATASSSKASDVKV